MVDTPRLRYTLHISVFVLILITALYRDLSSDRWAWLQTNGAAGFRRLDYLSDDTTWGTVGTRGALSLVHLDDAGLCTSTQVLTGKKYWAVFDRDPTLPDDDPRGDMGSIAWAPTFEDWYYHRLKGIFRAEAIEMGPRTLLYVFTSLASLPH
jgi:hypothetical protein